MTRQKSQNPENWFGFSIYCVSHIGNKHEVIYRCTKFPHWALNPEVSKYALKIHQKEINLLKHMRTIEHSVTALLPSDQDFPRGLAHQHLLCLPYKTITTFQKTIYIYAIIITIFFFSIFISTHYVNNCWGLGITGRGKTVAI